MRLSRSMLPLICGAGPGGLWGTPVWASAAPNTRLRSPTHVAEHAGDAGVAQGDQWWGRRHKRAQVGARSSSRASTSARHGVVVRPRRAGPHRRLLDLAAPWLSWLGG